MAVRVRGEHLCMERIYGGQWIKLRSPNFSVRAPPCTELAVICIPTGDGVR